MAEEFITIARVRKPQGRNGEVACDLWTDFPERFAERKQVVAVMPGGEQRRLQIESHWLHKGMVVLKFAGVESISDAEELKDAEIRISRAERVRLEAGAYISDLVGCVLSDRGTPVGSIRDVQFGAGEAPLLVVTGVNGKEFLVPFAEEFLVKLDTVAQRVEMVLPAGLLEVDAPLSAEEKSQMQSAERKRARHTGR